MNTRVSSITLALLLVINSVVIAETTTMFVREDDESSQIILYLEEDVADDDTILRFPNAEVLDASYDVVGGLIRTEITLKIYLSVLIIMFGNTVERDMAP